MTRRAGHTLSVFPQDRRALAARARRQSTFTSECLTMKYRGSCHCGKVTIERRRRLTERRILQLLHLLEARLAAVVRAARPDVNEAHGRVGTDYLHLQQTRHQTPVSASTAAFCPFGEGTDPKGVATAADQHPLPR